MTEPLYVRLNRKWKEERDRVAKELTGKTDEECELEKIRKYHSQPDYVPTWKERGFASQEEYFEALKNQDNSYDEKVDHLENGVLQGTIDGGRRSERSINTYYGDDLEKGYDY